eukprot:m.240761 g.240761  ORF g.240761 m.240761 type:complete len:78 (-) comp15923_c0_seq1:88-321(-)
MLDVADECPFPLCNVTRDAQQQRSVNTCNRTPRTSALARSQRTLKTTSQGCDVYVCIYVCMCACTNVYEHVKVRREV